MKWKDVKGYEGRYIISEFGDVKKLATKMPMPNGGFRFDKQGLIKPNINHKGYLQLRLSKSNKRKTFTVHRLVAIHFIKPVPGKKHVNHEDCNKLNNHYKNLSWCTNHENILHAAKNGRYKGNNYWALEKYHKRNGKQ